MASTKRQRDLKAALNRPKKIYEILSEQLETALEGHMRSKPELLFSSFSAGLEIGFSVFLMATLHTMFAGQFNDSQMHILLSVAYPLGFIFVIIGRSELFTEQTTLAVLPVLNRNASIKSLLVLWGIIYAGNLLGGYVFSLLLSWLPVRMGIINTGSLAELAQAMIDYRWYVILGSGVLAGWLMGLLSWLATSSQETISRIFIVVMVTTVIGIGSLHHSIVGSVEVFTGYIVSSDITIGDYLYNQVWSTLGNIIGGVVFVAIVKFSHVNLTDIITKKDAER
jgi:formate/nitrite transporter FocA (FNT family)